MKIVYYEVYDSCYRGHRGNSIDSMHFGSAVFRTTDKRKAQRIVNIMKPIAKKERQFEPSVREKTLVLDENEIDVDNMSNEEIIDWMVNYK